MELRQGSSEEVPPSSNVSALWISWRFRGAGRIRWSAGCPCRFFFILRNPTLTAGYERLSLAFLCRSLLPGLERLPKALNGFFMPHTTCFWLAIFDYAQSIVLCEPAVGPFPPDNTARLSANALAPSFGGSFTPEVDGFLRLPWSGLRLLLAPHVPDPEWCRFCKSTCRLRPLRQPRWGRGLSGIPSLPGPSSDLHTYLLWARCYIEACPPSGISFQIWVVAWLRGSCCPRSYWASTVLLSWRVCILPRWTLVAVVGSCSCCRGQPMTALEEGPAIFWCIGWLSSPVSRPLTNQSHRWLTARVVLEGARTGTTTLWTALAAAPPRSLAVPRWFVGEWRPLYSCRWEIRQKPFRDFLPVLRILWGFAAPPHRRTRPCEFSPWPGRDFWISQVWKPFNTTLTGCSTCPEYFGQPSFCSWSGWCHPWMPLLEACTHLYQCAPLEYWTRLPSVGSASPVRRGKEKSCTP